MVFAIRHGVLGYEAMGLNRLFKIFPFGVQNYEATRSRHSRGKNPCQDGEFRALWRRIVRWISVRVALRMTRVAAKTMSSAIDPAVVDDRLPVWEALSEFFLETELGDMDYQRISEVLTSSPYSIQEMENILRLEVYPVLIWNLRSIAGQWTDFDREWLRVRMEPRLNRRPWLRMPLLHWGLIRDHWTSVSTLIRHKREPRT
jgi:hypothetical protein